MKRYYVEYARHCLRYYVMTLEIGSCPKFDTETDKLNWLACQKATKDFDAKTMAIVKELYRPGDTIPDKVYQLARRMRVPQGSIWRIIDTLEHDVAENRGLL